MKQTAESSLLQSVSKVLDVLESFSPEIREVGVTELAHRLGIGKSTAYRLLASLEQRGYLRQDPKTSKYRLSLKLWELGCIAVGQLEFRDEIHPILEELAKTLEETIHLGILDGDQVVFVDGVESRQAVRAYLPIGSRAPAIVVSAGRVLLAYHPDPSLIEAILARGVTPQTPLTMTDPAELRAQLALVRANGYAINRGEWRIDVCGMAVPVRNYTGEVVAAIGISMPASRFTDEMVARSRAALLEAATIASERLGFRAGSTNAMPADLAGEGTRRADRTRRSAARSVEHVGRDR